MFLLIFVTLFSVIFNLNCSSIPICSPSVKLADSKFCNKYYECIKSEDGWKLEERYCENELIFDQATSECKVENDLINKCTTKFTFLRPNSNTKRNRKMKKKTRIPIKLSKNWIAIYIKGCDEDELEDANEEFEENFYGKKKPNLIENKNLKDENDELNENNETNENTKLIKTQNNLIPKLNKTNIPNKVNLNKNINTDLKQHNKEKLNKGSNNNMKSNDKINKVKDEEINWNSNIVFRKKKPINKGLSSVAP